MVTNKLFYVWAQYLIKQWRNIHLHTHTYAHKKGTRKRNIYGKLIEVTRTQNNRHKSYTHPAIHPHPHPHTQVQVAHKMRCKDEIKDKNETLHNNLPNNGRKSQPSVPSQPRCVMYALLQTGGKD